MPRPFTRAQALQNAAFLRQLRLTGNVREAARVLGLHRGTLTRRRAKHPAFAAQWDAALAAADAAGRVAAAIPPHPDGGDARLPRPFRTRSGRLQLRLPVPGRLTHEAEQLFLRALSATANIRLAAKAAGFSHTAFYMLGRRNPGFAREMRLALERGFERVEAALIDSMSPASHADDAWRHNAPPAMPRMTPEQALQLLHLRDKADRFWIERPDRKRRRGETSDACSARLVAKYHAERAREAEDDAVARADERDRACARLFEPKPPALPDLEQVRLSIQAGRAAAVETPQVRLESGPATDGARGADGGAGKADATAPFARAEGEVERRGGRVRRSGVALFGGWRFENG